MGASPDEPDDRPTSFRVECPACGEDMVDTGRREYDARLKADLRIMHCPKCGNEAASWRRTDAVAVLEKVDFHVARRGKHIVMTDGQRIVTIPQQNPFNTFTMGGIAWDAGLTPEAFRKLSKTLANDALLLSARAMEAAMLALLAGRKL